MGRKANLSKTKRATEVMKICVFILLQLFGITWCWAQEKEACATRYSSQLRRELHTLTTEMPEFAGGTAGLLKFLRKKFTYPKGEQELQSKINLLLVIEPDGRVSYVGIADKIPAQYTRVERKAVADLSQWPKWKPARCNGKEVAFEYGIPYRVCFQ
jgi:protein TonB